MQIVALNIPKLVPEMMLSSMNDPGDATEACRLVLFGAKHRSAATPPPEHRQETFAALANLPSRAGTNMQAQIKDPCTLMPESAQSTTCKVLEGSCRRRDAEDGETDLR